MSELRCETCGDPVAAKETGVLLIHDRLGERRAYCAEHADRRPPKVRTPSRQRQLENLADELGVKLRNDDAFLIEPESKKLAIGDEFALASLTIRITRLHTIREKGEHWGWRRAEFIRRVEERPFLLGKRGYTHEPAFALRADDEPDAATLDGVNPLARPPEPEGIPPHEVGQLPSALQAKTRYIETQSEVHGSDLAEQQGKHLMRRMRQLQVDAAKHGVDLAPRLIGMIREAEQAVGDARRDAAA